MGFLKQILTPFIEFDSDDNKKIVPNVVPVAKQVDKNEPAHHPLITDFPENEISSPSPMPTTSMGVSVPFPEHVQYFEALIDKANRENPMFIGADYKEFVDAKIDIDDIADETIKYQTAFNILKTSGLTKDKLITTGQEYLNIVGRDLNAFQSAHAQQYKKELQKKEQDLSHKVAELQALTQKINLLKGQINQLSSEINQSSGKLNTTKSSFLMAGELKQQEIQAELEKIGKYFG